MIMTFSASHLVVRNVPAAVRILPHDAQHMTVDLADLVSDTCMFVWQEGKTLMVEGAPGASGKSSVLEPHRSGSLWVTSEDVRPGDEEDEDMPLITIAVPRKTSVAVAGVAGYTSIGDIEGLLLLVTSPLSGPVQVGRMSGGTVLLQGSGRVTVADIRGEALQLTVLGMGMITVHDGEVDLLSSAIQGTGQITFAGAADMATLLIKGTGTISVEHVSSPALCMPGNGTIRVGGVLYQ